ncbi:MAG: putative beta-lysine N-acetyltransferase [Eubacteriales bacterium]
MVDRIEKIGGSMIQHGKYSDRVYLIKICKKDYPIIIDKIDKLAKLNNYSKIFIKAPSWAKQGFESNGYKIEAFIPNFYNGIEDAFFMAKYLSTARETISNQELLDKIIETAKNTEPIKIEGLRLDNDFTFAKLEQKDSKEMSVLYKKVFETYPFPIHDPDYVASTMNEDFIYFGIRHNGRLVAVSSCEMDVKSSSVEMTDFATLPEYRAKGLASFLLMKMESEMSKKGIKTAFTIARAVSYGMNIAFAKHKYVYAGTLKNNTNIFGGIESMNVWYKALEGKT